MVSIVSLQLLHFGAHVGTAIATGVLGYWVVFRTELSVRRWIGLWLGNFAVWSAVSAATVVVTNQPTAFVLFWLWTFVGLTSIYLTYLFPTAYSGRNPLTNTVCRLAGGIYVLLALLVVTGPFHGLYWQSVSFLSSPFPHFSVEYGPGWIAAIIYSLGAVATLLYYFAELYFRSRRRHRQLVAVLSVGIVVALVPVALSVFDLLIPTYEYLTFVGSLQALTVGYVAVQLGPATLSSIAREETLDTLVDPYLALDSEFRIVDFNTASSQLIDELTVDQLGEPLAAVFPQLAERLTNEGGINAPVEPVTFDVDDSTQHYAVDISPISDWRSTRCYAVVLNNVTELEATRQQLEAQNETLDAFVGTVSHDLRNPLSVMSGRLKLAQTECESEHLSHIEELHGRMDELIEDLLALAREGENVGETTAVELAAVAEFAARSVEVDADSVAIETNQTVLADRSRLQQLLENLLRNAVGHSSTGSRPEADDSPEAESTESTAALRITVGELDDGFYFEDNGPGIPETDRETIFEPGYTTHPDGTGFGLAIVAEIVAAHGWEIRATAATGGGARFEITGVERAG